VHKTQRKQAHCPRKEPKTAPTSETQTSAQDKQVDLSASKRNTNKRARQASQDKQVNPSQPEQPLTAFKTINPTCSTSLKPEHFPLQHEHFATKPPTLIFPEPPTLQLSNQSPPDD
jgi:hypothetical protein